MGKKRDKRKNVDRRDDVQRGLPPLRPRNKLQGVYMHAIAHHKITCGTGVAGSGKTYIAARMAVEMLQDNTSPIDKIIISRPNQMEDTQTIGLLPGTIQEKLAPILAPVIQTLKEALGSSFFDYLVKKEVIEFLPLEMIKGRTFNNAFVIIDEAEDMTWNVIKTLLLRVGEDSRLVIDGDIRQTSLKSDSGLQKLMNLADQAYIPIQFIDFNSWDDHCVRSEECRLFGRTFEELGI
jgi:phosphate starvation-inducible protein PhoH and related proteins